MYEGNFFNVVLFIIILKFYNYAVKPRKYECSQDKLLIRDITFAVLKLNS